MSALRVLLHIGILAAVAYGHTGRQKRYAPARNYHHLLQDTLVPFHYDLKIRPDIYHKRAEDFRFDGNVTVHFKCRRTTNRIKLHAGGSLKIPRDSVHLTGNAKGVGRLKVTSMHRDDDDNTFMEFHLNKRLRRGSSYTISMSFSSVLGRSLIGLYYTGYYVGNEYHYMAITKMEPNYARWMFPCFDEPALKATFNITVLRKSSHVALSNMPLIKTELMEGGWIKDTFDKTPIMTTYLVAIAVTDYKFKEGYTRDGVKVRVWWREDELYKTELALDTAIKATEWFVNYTGVNYTLPKMDHIAVEDFMSCGMENWGLIVYKTWCMVVDLKKDHDYVKNVVGNTVIHEVAHQWFGNMVTAKWWNDIWINEGLTTYITMKCKDEILPKADVNFDHARARSRAFAMDGRAQAHPIDYTVFKPKDLRKPFDTITYKKGALILMMLEKAIGEKEFRHGIQILLETHPFGNADQYDIYDAFNEALHSSDNEHLSQVDVGEFLSTWIQQAGYPVLTVFHDYDRAKVNQTRFLKSPGAEVPEEFLSPFGSVWVIPFFVSTNHSGKAVEIPPVWMHHEEVDLSTEFNFTKGSKQTWILGNHGMKGYYIVNYDDRNWMLLADQLIHDHTVIPEKNRVELITDVAALARAGKIHVTKSLHLASYLRNEKDYFPWAAFFRSMTSLGANYLHTSANFGIFRTYMLDLIGHKYDDTTWEEEERSWMVTSHLQFKIIEQACKYEYPPCVQKAQEVYAHRQIKPVAREVRLTVYCTAIKMGTVDTWDEVYEAYEQNTKNDGGDISPDSEKLLRALICTREEWIMKRLFDRLLERDIAVNRSYDPVRELRKGLMFASSENSAIGARLALDFVLNRWNETVTKNDDVLTYIGHYITAREDLDRALHFNATHPEADDESNGTFGRLIETAKSNVNWSENDGEDIMKWMSGVYEPMNRKEEQQISQDRL